MLVLSDIPVIWRSNVQPTPIVDYRQEFSDSNCKRQVRSNEDVVPEDEESGRSWADFETDNRLAALRLDPGWFDAVKSAGISHTSRLELSKSERREIE